MGCGHSKINVYFRKSKSQNNNEYAPVNAPKAENEEKLIDPLLDSKEGADDYEYRKTSKVKPYGGVLLAQAEISTSQQNFFKLLDEKIENGPDYDSESEAEKAEREARLLALVQNWQSASLRSLNNTPVHKTQFRKDTSGDFPPERILSARSPTSHAHHFYANSMNQTYASPVPYISDHNQNTNLPYQALSTYSAMALQYRSVNYPQEGPQMVHQTSFTTYRNLARNGGPAINNVPETNYKQPVVYQPQYQPRQGRYCKQNPERTAKHNSYYNPRAENYNSSNKGGISLYEARMEMNPLHRKQYELT